MNEKVLLFNGLLFVLHLWFASAQVREDRQVRPILTPEPQQFECQELTDIPMCEKVGYTHASFPNYRNQFKQSEANNELDDFVALVERVCSNAVVHFLCSVYAPFCDANKPQFRVPPCRELCEHVRSGCEHQLVDYGLPWPPHLNCSHYPSSTPMDITFCPPNISTLKIPDNIPTLAPAGTQSTPSVVTQSETLRLTCPRHMVVTPDLRGYTFAGIANCSSNCSGVFFSKLERNIIAPVFILLFAFVCVAFTIFTVATFLIDRHRFHYPERPIIFLSFCYLVISIAYIVGAISKLASGETGAFSCTDGNNDEISPRSFVFQRLPSSDTSYRSASCVILFVLVYYFQMASALWWVILTFTWFLAAALKWGEEAVEKLWLLYHIIAWSIPAIQVILVLALRLVDGDHLAGICFTGNSNNIGLGVFVFLPLTAYLFLGIIFLVIGFSALVNIRHHLQRDPHKARKLGRLIMRICVYSLLYITPNITLLILYLYDLARNDGWQRDYVTSCLVGEAKCDSSVGPSFAAFLLRYLMIFAIGVCSTSWILSSKTFSAWHKFFCSCGCGSVDTATHTYDVPDKKNDLSIHGFRHPQTSV